VSRIGAWWRRVTGPSPREDDRDVEATLAAVSRSLQRLVANEGAAEAGSGIRVTMRRPLLATVRNPRLEIDDGPTRICHWGTLEVPAHPGRHRLTCWYPLNFIWRGEKRLSCRRCPRVGPHQFATRPLFGAGLRGSGRLCRPAAAWSTMRAQMLRLWACGRRVPQVSGVRRCSRVAGEGRCWRSHNAYSMKEDCLFSSYLRDEHWPSASARLEGEGWVSALTTSL